MDVFVTDKPIKKEDNFRDRHSNVNEKGRRRWVFALQPHGRLYQYRQYLAFLYLGLFFALPFIKINGLPALQLNFPEARFIILGKIFWPDDFIIFAVAMIVLIVFIALFTVIYGRVFCGWVCPQTIFMEFVFRKIEWWIEGSPTQQKKLSQEPFHARKLIRKAIKHLLFFIISFLIAHTFLSYILGARKVLDLMSGSLSENAGIFAGLLFFTVLFYFVFAFVRDIVCTTVCPYGRLQGVLFDKDTMQVSYDYNRGEPRGKLKKNSTGSFGDCIDCKLCVHVCPTGIDIRNGVQMECVGCTACIDACNSVMLKINRPPGLIRMASENQISKKQPFHFNGRMQFYSVILMVLAGLMSFLVFSRKSIDTTISRVKGQLYQEVGTDSLSNLFQAKVINKTKKDVQYELKIEGNVPGIIKRVDADHNRLKAESLSIITFFITVPKSAIRVRSTDMTIGVYTEGIKAATVRSKFLGPFI
ncbi:cytochrome c oxidase accessory protein CcoG [Niabella ginsenosidivorans]|uniref:Cytochrome c oxidase accessory protein CcoG n=1 Tax=Niabella ginsenosidivorans TaxID=1176587 RepID=A0A1A9I0Y7_9BACT|nr:cytochrome c oxidase accessory protein CcoG [Niabella ginsenosidivorans]ANH81327.1 cytochrome c oxidase accessory protein CcoG [Niabella ginsenosidivorans]